MFNIKIKYGLPKANEYNEKMLLEAGWKRLKEPKSFSGQIALSIPFMVINFIISQFIVGIFASNKTFSFSFSSFIDLFVGISIFLLIQIILMFSHELLHLVFVPNFTKSDKTHVGYTWFCAYVYSEEVLSKGRACLIYIAPFILLSIIFNFLLGLLGLYSIPTLIFLMLNSIGSGLDMLGVTLILLQVPKGGKVVNNGIYTYYK